MGVPGSYIFAASTFPAIRIWEFLDAPGSYIFAASDFPAIRMWELLVLPGSYRFAASEILAIRIWELSVVPRSSRYAASDFLTIRIWEFGGVTSSYRSAASDFLAIRLCDCFVFPAATESQSRTSWPSTSELGAFGCSRQLQIRSVGLLGNSDLGVSGLLLLAVTDSQRWTSGQDGLRTFGFPRGYRFTASDFLAIQV